MTFYPNTILLLNDLVSFCMVYSPDSYIVEKIFWSVLSGQPTGSEFRREDSWIVLSWWCLLFLEPPSSLSGSRALGPGSWEDPIFLAFCSHRKRGLGNKLVSLWQVGHVLYQGPYSSGQRILILCIFTTVISSTCIKSQSLCSKILRRILLPVFCYLEKGSSYSECSQAPVLWDCVSLLLSCLWALLC